MNNKIFFESFRFRKLSFSKNRHTDCFTNNGAHTNFIGHLLKGSAKLVSKHGTVYLEEGEIVYIPKECRYHSYWYTDNNSELEWYSLGFDYLPLSDNGNYTLQKIQPDKHAMEILSEITDSLSVNSANVGKLYLFLSEIFPKMERDCKPYEISIEKAVEFMQNNAEYKMCDVAKYCNISEAGLYTLFRKHFGKTPNEVKQRVTCEKAEELLISTNLSVEDISEKLGFSSASYFRKILKKHTGLTPKEIRRTRGF